MKSYYYESFKDIFLYFVLKNGCHTHRQKLVSPLWVQEILVFCILCL